MLQSILRLDLNSKAELVAVIPHDIYNGLFMHDDLQISITFFHSFADNEAKSVTLTWGEVAARLTAPPAAALSHKSLLPLFSPWRYKSAADSAVSNGTDRSGNPVEHFSKTHVRRIGANLVDISMLVLDFDGLATIDEVMERLRDMELVLYTTLNHQVDGMDKFRVVLLFANPIRVDQFGLIKEPVKTWAVGLGADPSTVDINRMFILPAVRDEHRHLAQSWHQIGSLLDWRMFSEMPKPVVAAPPALADRLYSLGQIRKLLPDDVIETANGHIIVRDIARKISNVRCPFHPDPAPSEFVNVTKRGTPFLVCKKCGTVFMERAQSDGISEGIAQILAKKKQRTGGV